MTTTSAGSQRTDSNPTTPLPGVWTQVRYADAPAAITFLQEAFGFDVTLVVPGEADGTIAHAELRWPSAGGGVMLASVSPDDSICAEMKPGTSWIYLAIDDPDRLHDRAVAAGARIVEPLHDTEHGSRDFAARDLEGGTWCFGTYSGS